MSKRGVEGTCLSKIDPDRQRGFHISLHTAILHVHLPRMIKREEEKRGSFHGMRKPSVSILAKPLIKRDSLFSASVWEVMKVMEIFRETCVERVCSRHCTEDSAPSPFRDSYGEQFMEGGVGRVIRVT